MLTFSEKQNTLAERFEAGDHIRYDGRLGTFIRPATGFQKVEDEPKRLVLVHVIGDTRCSFVAAEDITAAS